MTCRDVLGAACPRVRHGAIPRRAARGHQGTVWREAAKPGVSDAFEQFEIADADQGQLLGVDCQFLLAIDRQ